MAQVEFPETLFEYVRAKSCVLCTGVRFAAAAGMPDWNELFSRMKEKLGGQDESLEKLIAGGDLLTVAGHLRRKLGAEQWESMLKEAYGKEGELPELHRLLGEIPFYGAIYTGFDTLLERALTHNGTSPRVYTYEDGSVLRLAEDLSNFVLKVHGDVKHDAPLVLTLTDFRRVISPNQAYRAFMEDLYRTRTLLLVGFHITDPDFVLFLDRLVGSFRESVADHYAIMSGVSGPEAEELYANFRIRVIPYEEGDDPHQALASVLADLRDQWRAKGEALPGPEDPAQKAHWLRQQLAPVELRLDVMGQEGLSLSEGRLSAIHSAASELDPEHLDAEALCRLGNVKLYLADVQGARACYEAALVKEPSLAAAHLNLHHTCAESGALTEALEHLQKAVELEPSLRVIPERYELKAVLGRGTTGTIYQAQDTEEKREVVVKVLRAAYVREHLSPERWLEDTEKLKALLHENIAHIHDALIEGGRCILITEHLKGKSLSALLREKGTLPPDISAEVLGQVCEGLQAAHEQGILHLDVMPSNIFIKENGTAVLMDFRTGRGQKGRHVAVKKGSEGYQAPELLAGAGGDARSDVYSLGAVLYTMLTGKAAIGSFLRVAELNPAARRLDSLVARALRATPEERPQSVEQFAKALMGGSEEVVLPEREDDLEGWLEVLAYQPDSEKVLTTIKTLETRYREEKDWDNLVQLLLGWSELESDSPAREKKLREVARIFEREVGDLGKAFAALQAAFRENPNNVEVRQDLERLAGATGMWNELLQEYNSLVQTLRDPKVSCDWLVRMGRLYSHELGYDDYAAASFNQALALDGNRIDALTELAEVQRRQGKHKELARTLTRLAELEEEKARKIEILRELAQLYIKDLRSDEESILTYRKILELDQAHSAAVAALEGLYRKSEMWEELVQLLQSRVEITEVADELRAHRYTLAELLSEKLARPDAAIEQYQKLIQMDADDSAALRGLEKLYDATGRNQEYLEILDRRIAAAKTNEEKIALCRRMSGEWEAQEDGKERAAEYLEKVVEIGGGDDETYKALVRLYWAIPDYVKLVNAYGRHIKIARKPEDRATLYAALGKVHEEHLKDDGKAIEVFNSLLSVEPKSKIALTALARLYEKTNVWAQAVAMLEKLTVLEENVDEQANLFCRIGTIQYRQLKRDKEAEVSLVKAMELKEDHIDSLLTLAELYRERKDYGKAARVLGEAADHTTNELQKVSRLHLAGITFQDDLEDTDRALEVFEQLLAIDPEHIETGERVAAIYEKKGEKEKAETVLEMLVRKAEATDRVRLVELNLRLGFVALDTGNEDRALAALRVAYDLDPTNQDSLLRLAELLYKRKEHEEASKLFQALLVHRRDTLSPKETVSIFYKLGDIKEEQGEKNKALNMYEKALDYEPANPKVLARAVSLYEEKGDIEAVLRCKKNILKNAKEADLRMSIAEEIGDLLHEKLKRPNEAVAHYRMVTEIKPDHRRVLNKIMDVFIEQKRWDEAIAAMGKIEDYETDPIHRSRMHYTAAVIFRDEMGRLDDAAHHLDQALLKDPTNRKAFEALKNLHTEQGYYKGLAKAYRTMLQRLPEETPVPEKVQLWHELGELCQDKLKDAREAIVAFEAADKLDPRDEGRQERLSRLYASAGPDAYKRAIAVSYRLLRNNPLRLEAYKDLRRIYADIGQHDRAWCLCAVLSLLNKASAEEEAFFQKHRPQTCRRLTRKLSGDLWASYLSHDSQSRGISEVLAAVADIIAPMTVRPYRAHGLREKEKLDFLSDPRPYAASAKYMAQVMDVRPQEMFLHGEAAGPFSLVLAGTSEDYKWVLKVSPQVVKSENETELGYWFAKSYAMMRPENLLCFAAPSSTVLRAVILACLKLMHPGLRISGDVNEIDRLAAALKADMPPGRFDFMSERIGELRATSTEERVGAWMNGVDLSVTRAALVVCDDLETAAKLLTLEPPARRMDAKTRMKELLLFAISEPYFKIREILGRTIGPS